MKALSMMLPRSSHPMNQAVRPTLAAATVRVIVKRGASAAVLNFARPASIALSSSFRDKVRRTARSTSGLAMRIPIWQADDGSVCKSPRSDDANSALPNQLRFRKLRWKAWRCGRMWAQGGRRVRFVIAGDAVRGGGAQNGGRRSDRPGLSYGSLPRRRHGWRPGARDTRRRCRGVPGPGSRRGRIVGAYGSGAVRAILQG